MTKVKTVHIPKHIEKIKIILFETLVNNVKMVILNGASRALYCALDLAAAYTRCVHFVKIYRVTVLMICILFLIDIYQQKIQKESLS